MLYGRRAQEESFQIFHVLSLFSLQLFHLYLWLTMKTYSFFSTWKQLAYGFSVITVFIWAHQVDAQCTGCQYTITVPNSATHNLTSGQVVCITGSGSFTGQLNNFNGNTLCIGAGVTYNPSSAPNYNGNWTINNYGTFSNTNNINFNNGNTFYNGSTGSISFSSSKDINGTFTNDGTATFGGGVKINGSGTATLGGTSTISGGSLEVNGTLAITGGSSSINITSLKINGGGTATINVTTAVSGQLEVNGTLSSSSTTATLSAGSMKVNGGGNVTLGMQTSIAGTMEVNGSVIVSNSVSANAVNTNGGATIQGGNGSGCNSLTAPTISGGGTIGGGSYSLLISTSSSITPTSPATTTAPSAPANQFAAPSLSISGNNIVGTLSNPGGTPASSGYIVLRRVGAAVSNTPTDFVTYSVGNTIGSSTVVAVNSVSTLTFTDNNALSNGCGIYYYAVFGYNNSGSCGNYNTSMTGNSASINPTVTPSVAAAASPSNSVCAGTSVTFTATPTNGGSAPTYQWKRNGADVGTGGTTYAYVPTNGDAIIVVMTANNTCQTAATATSSAVNMTVTAYPNAGTISGNINICEGSTSSLSTNGVGGGTWSSSNTGVATVNSGTGVVTAVAGGQTTITYTVSTAGCASSTNTTATVAGFTNPISIPNSLGNTRVADLECVSGSWTYYFDMSNGGELLLGLQKNGNNIGSVGNPGFSLTLGMPNGSAGAIDMAAMTPKPPYITGTSWVVMNRYWNLTPVTQPTTPVNVRFYYRLTDYDEVNAGIGNTLASNTEMVFYKVVGAAPYPWTNHSTMPASQMLFYNNGATASQTTWRAGNTANGYPYAEYQVTSFSGGGGGGGAGVPLPAQETELSIADNALSWTSQNDQLAQAYAVERSADGQGFAAIAEVAATGGSGYQFTDAAQLEQTEKAFYRIRRIDLDGASRYSNIVERNIHGNTSRMASVFPNPTQKDISILLGNGWSSESQVTLLDALGRVMMQRTAAEVAKANTWSLDGLAKGMYLLRISDGGEHTQTVRITKE